MTERPILAATMTPEGVRVVVFADTWHDHILGPEVGHAEMAPHLDAVVAVIATPDHREPDERRGRERFYKQGVGPSRWLMVVVSFEQEPARVITALGYRHGRSPAGWIP